MIGGMVGNNSCGSRSIIYGSTRDHLLELKTILSDGSEATFGSLTREEFEEKCNGQTLENKIYRHFKQLLSQPEVADEIRKEFPKPSVKRRNTGYAVDMFLQPILARSLIFASYLQDLKVPWLLRQRLRLTW
jgi:hypothetical protein